MREEEGLGIVKGIVNDWSKVYINQVFFVQEYANILQYEVEFSKPHQTKPIPEGTVKVYFNLIQLQSDSGDDSGYEIEFNFENESLKHKLNNSMRKNMFEQWINRVLENKLKIKLQLHLGTEFEYTRLVDKKGQKIDPFVPKYDIMKIQDLGKDIKKSQKIYVQSPRFIKTLERALVAILQEADTQETGELGYHEFYNAFKKLANYDLCENDLRTLLALADENPNGKITWRDFIPYGINAVQVFLERNKQQAKQKEEEKVSLKPDLLKTLYDAEIKKVNHIMLKRFEAFDTDKDTGKHSGLITFQEMQVCFNSTSHMTPKETNFLLRDYSMKQGMDQINYTNFAADLYMTRFELANSRIMDINMDIIDKVLVDQCSEVSEDGKTVTLIQLQKVLRESKQLVLTPFQIALLMGYSKPDKEAKVDFHAFAKISQENIQAMFKIEAQRRKAQLVAVGQFRTSDVKMPAYKEGSIFGVFRADDGNNNGFLEWYEYQMCLESLTELGLTKEESLTLNLLADIDGNGRIDYQEFMKHFEEILYIIKFHNELQAHYDELPERLQEKMAMNQQQKESVSPNTE